MKNHIFARIKEYNALWRETTAIYEEWAKARGFSYYELLVMLSINEMENKCTQKEICREWFLPKQTVNTILQNFLKKEWINFVPMESDKRNKLIIMTDIGEKHIKKICAELNKNEYRAWEKLGEEMGKTMLKGTSLYNKFFKEGEPDESL